METSGDAYGSSGCLSHEKLLPENPKLGTCFHSVMPICNSGKNRMRDPPNAFGPVSHWLHNVGRYFVWLPNEASKHGCKLPMQVCLWLQNVVPSFS